MLPPEPNFQTSAPQVRAAAIADVPVIHHLLEYYAAKGNLLPRTFSELYRHLRDFFVVEIGGKVVACAALEIFTEDLGEVRTVGNAVDLILASSAANA